MFVIRHYEHPSAVFRELDPTQVTLNKRSHCAFTFRKDNEVIRVFQYMEPMTNLVFHNMMISFLERIKNPDRGCKAFSINNNELIQSLKNRFLQQVSAPSSAAARGIKSWGQPEVALHKKSIEKVSQIFSSYFQKSQHVFSVSDDINTYQDYVGDAVVSLYEEVYNSFKFKKIEISPSFSPTTLREFEVPKGTPLRDPHKMPCYSFAYMQVKEKRAVSIIFEESKSDEPIANIFTQLREWKYQAVDWPTAGDLVVYLTKDKVATHVGVYQASGKVLSKLGISQRAAHEHELFDVPVAHYGRSVVFFRKPAGKT